jgi:DNA polymerase/3'-5' exonuclease PolX
MKGTARQRKNAKKSEESTEESADEEVIRENKKIASKLSYIADLYGTELQVYKRQGADQEVIEGTRRRMDTYQKASKNVSQWEKRITDKLKPGVISGVGKSIVTDIKEYLKDGEMSRLEKLDKLYGELYNASKTFIVVNQIGRKKAFDLAEQGYRTIEEIPKEQLTRGMKLGIKHLEKAENRISRKEIQAIEARIDLDCTWAITGSYRRGEPTSGDIDIIIAGCKMDKVLESLDWLLGDIITSGPKTTTAYTKKGYRIDLKIVPEESYWYALLHFTGSGGFNNEIRKHAKSLGLKLSEYGLYARSDDPTNKDKYKEYGSVVVPGEEFIFVALDLKYIPPKDRTPTVALEHI